MNINIRRAVKEDCPRLLQLLNELATHEGTPQNAVRASPFAESGFGTNPTWWAFVAEAGGAVQGFALYSTSKGQIMFLEDFIVTETLRGQGVGKLLFDRLIEEAKAKGFNRIVWQVLKKNTSAINFYNKYNTEIEHEKLDCSIEV